MRPQAILAVLLCLAGSSLPGCHLTVATPPSPAPPIPAPVRLGPIRFADVATSAGLSYRWAISGSRPLNILQGIGNGCAFLDYNKSGNLSVLLVGTDHIALYRGDGNGHFTDVSQSMGLADLKGHFLGCAVGDYDNDGYADLYISGYRTGLLLHNNAGKSFTNVTQKAGIKPQPWGTSCAFADVSGSGRLDLYVCNYVAFGPQTKPQLCLDGGPGHLAPSACGPSHYHKLKGVLYQNLGGGKFQDVTHNWGLDTQAGKGLGAAFAPSPTGKTNLALANDTEPGNLFRSVRSHALTERGVASGIAYGPAGRAHGGMGVDWGDYDNDGRLDLFVATFYDELKCLYHNSGEVFDNASQSAGLSTPSLNQLTTFGCKFMDADNDGWLDLVLVNGHIQDNVAQFAYYDHSSYRQTTRFLHNEGGKQFSDLSEAAGPDLTRPVVGRGLAVGDFDNDGRVDALVVDSEGAPLLLHNESKPVGHWIGFELIGTGRSNRDAYGAIVTLKAGGRTLTRFCHADGSYLSSSDKRVHFGLGDAARADVVSVRWPDGRVETRRHLPAGRYVRWQEGYP